jgi:hypothetical protein
MRPDFDFPPSTSRFVIRRSALAAVSLLLFAPLAATAPPAAPVDDVAKIEAGIGAAHERFLRYPGGIGIRYRLEFEPNPKETAYFVFRKGLDGLVNVRWPEFRARVEGPFFTSSADPQDQKKDDKVKTQIREGSFNFETFTGVMHDGDSLGQITNYRDPFSSASAYPLRFQFFAEVDQSFRKGPEYKTEYWLPHALRSGGYTVIGSETVNGIPCQVLRKEGLDTIWVATGHGHVVCKREHNYQIGKSIRERTVNSDLKEIAPGVWIPMTQVKEAFVDRADGVLEAKYTIRVIEVKIGTVSDSDTRVVLPDTIERVDDMITGKVYKPNTVGELDTAIQQAKESNLDLGKTARRARVLTGVLTLAVMGFGVLVVHSYRRWRVRAA